jgi:phosphatidylglycerophosphatase A
MTPSPWHPASLIATFFCVGKIPKAPGTFGSLAAFPFMWLLCTLVEQFYPHTTSGPERLVVLFAVVLALLVVLFIVGCWASKLHMQRCGKEDPGEIVIDEVVGQGLVLLLVLPLSLLQPPSLGMMLVSLSASFILFRYFDITKPWPVNWCDRTLKGGFGVMFDDVAAALMAVMCFYIGWFIYDDFIHGISH